MKILIELTDTEASVLREAATRNSQTPDAMAQAYIRDHLRIERTTQYSRRRMYREDGLQFTPLTETDIL